MRSSPVRASTWLAPRPTAPHNATPAPAPCARALSERSTAPRFRVVTVTSVHPGKGGQKRPKHKPAGAGVVYISARRRQLTERRQ